MEDDATGPESAGLGSTQPAAQDLAAKLRQLEDEAARIRASLNPAAARDASQLEPAPAGQSEPPASEDEPELPASTPEQITAAENLIRQARLARQRNQQQRADDLLKEAEMAAPNAAIVLEAIGDDYYGKGQLQKAREAYKKAFKLEPKNVSIERKFALTLVRTDSAANLLKADIGESPAGAKVPALLSAIIPGLGQIVMGEIPKGVALIAVTLVCWIWIGLTPSGVAGLVGFVMGQTGQRPGQTPFNAVILIPILAGFITWIIAVAGATVASKGRGPRIIEHPRPPADLPFE